MHLTLPSSFMDSLKGLVLNEITSYFSSIVLWSKASSRSPFQYRPYLCELYENAARASTQKNAPESGDRVWSDEVKHGLVGVEPLK